MRLIKNYYLYYQNHGSKFVWWMLRKQLGCNIKKIVATLQGKSKVTSVYSEQFFHEITEMQLPSAKVFVNELCDFFNPKSVVDLGCGNGLHLNEFQKKAIEIKGVDGSQNGKKTALIDPDLIDIFDLTKELDLHKQYDLAICTEVAEHIDHKFSQLLVRNITRHSDNVFFTAAVPGQGGEDHVNEQPNEYWIKLFDDEGYEYLSKETQSMRETLTEKNVVSWLANNAMIFKKR